MSRELLKKQVSRRSFIRAGAGLAAASALSACAAPARPAPPAASEAPVQSTAASASTPPERYNGYKAPGAELPAGKLQFYVGLDAESEKKLQAEFDDVFTKLNPGVSVEILNVAGDEKLMALIAAGTPPDVWWAPHAGIIQVADGSILNIADYLKDDPIMADVLPAYVNMFTGLDGGLYGLPNGAWFWLIYYNKKMFDAAGLSYPAADWTWDDLLTNAQKMTAGEQWGYMNSGLIWGGGLYPFILSNGGREISEDGTRWMLDTPESLGAIQFLYDMIHTHKVMPSPETLKGLGITDRQAFANGKIAMQTDGSPPDWTFATYAETLGWGNFDVVVLPHPAGKSLVNWMGSGGFSVSARTSNPQAAVELLKFLVTGSALWWPSASYRSGVAAYTAIQQERLPQLADTQWQAAYEYGAQKTVFSSSSNPFTAARYTGPDWGAFLDRLLSGKVKPEDLKTEVPAWNAKYAAGLEKDLQEIPLKPAYEEALKKLLDEVKQRA